MEEFSTAEKVETTPKVSPMTDAEKAELINNPDNQAAMKDANVLLAIVGNNGDHSSYDRLSFKHIRDYREAEHILEKLQKFAAEKVDMDNSEGGFKNELSDFAGGVLAKILGGETLENYRNRDDWKHDLRIRLGRAKDALDQLKARGEQIAKDRSQEFQEQLPQKHE